MTEFKVLLSFVGHYVDDKNQIYSMTMTIETLTQRKRVAQKGNTEDSRINKTLQVRKNMIINKNAKPNQILKTIQEF